MKNIYILLLFLLMTISSFCDEASVDLPDLTVEFLAQRTWTEENPILDKWTKFNLDGTYHVFEYINK